MFGLLDTFMNLTFFGMPVRL